MLKYQMNSNTSNVYNHHLLNNIRNSNTNTLCKFIPNRQNCTINWLENCDFKAMMRQRQTDGRAKYLKQWKKHHEDKRHRKYWNLKKIQTWYIEAHYGICPLKDYSHHLYIDRFLLQNFFSKGQIECIEQQSCRLRWGF